MGQPAARIGDPTAHGGAINKGAVTVTIGKMAAARAGDTHLCPMMNGPQVHGTGIISKGSTTVFIEKLPAARQGDIVACPGPPNSISMGFPTVLIGG